MRSDYESNGKVGDAGKTVQMLVNAGTALTMLFLTGLFIRRDQKKKENYRRH